MLIVQKSGGTSLGDDGKVMNAARRAVMLARQGTAVVMVVSAQGHTTDEMIQKAQKLNKRGNLREMDAYLSAGEQMSASLMAMAIGALGYPAVSLNGSQAGIHTDSVHGNAQIRQVDTGRILRELEAGKIVVTAGFQGTDPLGTSPPWAGAVPTPLPLLWLRRWARINARSLRMWTESMTGIPDYIRMPGGSAASAMKKC